MDLNNLKEYADVLIPIGSFISGLGALKLAQMAKSRFYVEPKAEEPQQLRVVERKKESKHREEARQRFSYSKRENAGKSLDDTKRKTLQPGNIHTIKEVVNKTVHDVKNFEHKFFGTILQVENKILIDSLPKKLHIFEVVDGVCYVDGVVVKLHPDDVLKLARSLE